jgi:hypothetical protein
MLIGAAFFYLASLKERFFRADDSESAFSLRLKQKNRLKRGD